MKCEKCGYISFDYNLECPSCGKDLSAVRGKLGINLARPLESWDEFFFGSSGGLRSLETEQPLSKSSKKEDDDFEFTLDD